jgi:hypothetical protein
VVFAVDPITVDRKDSRRVPHTFAVSGPVRTHLNRYDGSNSHRARDVAVIRLDRPVPADVALPTRPAGIASDPSTPGTSRPVTAGNATS